MRTLSSVVQQGLTPRTSNEWIRAPSDTDSPVFQITSSVWEAVSGPGTISVTSSIPDLDTDTNPTSSDSSNQLGIKINCAMTSEPLPCPPVQHSRSNEPIAAALARPDGSVMSGVLAQQRIARMEHFGLDANAFSYPCKPILGTKDTPASFRATTSLEHASTHSAPGSERWSQNILSNAMLAEHDAHNKHTELFRSLTAPDYLLGSTIQSLTVQRNVSKAIDSTGSPFSSYSRGQQDASLDTITACQHVRTHVSLRCASANFDSTGHPVPTHNGVSPRFVRISDDEALFSPVGRIFTKSKSEIFRNRMIVRSALNRIAKSSCTTFEHDTVRLPPKRWASQDLSALIANH